MPETTDLSYEQLLRYRDQLKVPGMTKEAQARLLKGKVIVLGNSGTGAVAAQALAQAGIGELILVDDSPKVLAKLNRLLEDKQEFGGDTRVNLKALALTDGQVEEMLRESDVVIDSLENWQEKLTLSDLCMSHRRPLVHAGVAGFRYQLFSMLPGKSACLRCALPLAGIDDVPLEPLKVGKIAAVLEMVGSWQAIEAIKLIARVGASQGNELFKFDCLSGEFEIVRGLDSQSDCPDCGAKSKRPRQL
jgi:molybdopterin/thiamine biosynthesis adenylyltransferase